MRARVSMTSLRRLVALPCVATAVALGACGSGAADGDPPVRTAREVEIVLGNGGGVGDTDGRGDAARFAFPSHVRTIDANSMLVIDGSSGRLRRVTRDGTVTTVLRTTQRMSGVAGLARLPDGAWLVPSQMERVVYRLDLDGRARVLAGRTEPPERPVDGVGADARFRWVWGGFNGADGRAYVLDDDGRTIRSVDAEGRVVTVPMPALSTPPVERFVDLAPAAGGGWWAIDDQSRHVFRLDAGGHVTLAVPAVVRAPDGTETERFREPTAIATHGDVVVIADPRGGAVRRIHPDGRVTTLYALPCPEFDPCVPGGRAGVPPLRSPRGIAFLDARTLAVADSINGAIYLLDLDGRVRRIAGLPAEVRAREPAEATIGGCIEFAKASQGEVICRDVELEGWWRAGADGSWRSAIAVARVQAAFEAAVAAIPDRWTISEWDPVRNLMLGATAPDLPSEFAWPQVLTIGTGVAYGLPYEQHVVLRIDPTGQQPPRLLAGREGDPGARDGPAGHARFRGPRGVAVGADGAVYVADSGNHAIRRIAADGTVTTWAGRLGASGFVDGVGEAARFVEPTRILFGPDGALYVADEGAGAVRRIDAQRRVTTFGDPAAPRTDVGCGCESGCALAVGAFAVDPRGRVWIAEGQTVGLLGADGNTRRVLGRIGSEGLAADGSADSLPAMFDVAFDARGDLLLAARDSLLRVRAATLEKRLAPRVAAGEKQRAPAMCMRDAGA